MAKWQRTKIKIPKEYGPQERRAIAFEVIEFIKSRTSKGKDKNNKAFPKYSSGYKKSLEFKLAGKTSNVNLRLTNEMMSSLDLLSNRSGELLIGYERSDKDLNGKVEGNRLGTYGQSKSTGKKRDFLGITDKDLRKVLSKFPTKGKDKGKRALDILKAAAAAGAVVDDVSINGQG